MIVLEGNPNLLDLFSGELACRVSEMDFAPRAIKLTIPNRFTTVTAIVATVTLLETLRGLTVSLAIAGPFIRHENYDAITITARLGMVEERDKA